MNHIVNQGRGTPQVFTPESLGFTGREAVLFAQAAFYARSTIVPKEYQGNESNCYIALKTADRLGMDPLFVMNGLSVIHGRPGWSSRSLNQIAKKDVVEDIDTPVDMSDPANWKCKAIAKTKKGETVTGMEISVKMAKDMGWWDRNPMWRNATELMLKHRASAWLINNKWPEVTAGFMTKEEIEDTAELQQRATTKPLSQLVQQAKEQVLQPAEPAVVVVEVPEAPEPATAPIPSFDGSEVPDDLPDMSELTEGQQSVEMFKRIAALVKERGYSEEQILERTTYTKTQIRKLDLIALVKVYKQLS